MIVVFDLDDILYDELSFVKSGFTAVSEFLYENYSLPKKSSLNFMVNRLKIDRNYIFDILLKKNNLYSKKLVLKCLSVYRHHKPNIKLYSDAKKCLDRLNKYKIYVVTDGNKMVQKNKLKRLGLYNNKISCILTSHYGLKYSKPSPYCFLKICEMERVKPAQVVYVGDNPYKDFVGIKPLGFKTIRVLKGRFKDVRLKKKYEANYAIDSLEMLTSRFLNNID
jgi:putative hydrolase of the HAD superfamily